MGQIGAALDRGMRPTTYILGVQPFGKWSKWDFLCGEAHAVVISERCHCGYPRWLCHSDDGNLGFKMIEDTCYVSREVEKHEAEVMGKKKDKEKWGVKIRPEPFMYDGSQIDPEMREAYYKAEWKKANPES